MQISKHLHQKFAPVILLFKNEEEIYSEYQRIIREYEDRNQSFKESANEDKVLVWARSWSSIVKKRNSI